ncbi:MAG TPA: LytTR family DNA-binding domain-containing protein [Candidatus Nitrosocosmicus sp.]|nr:LytTR family DNA-binding domain-containing protein [Candidatus Nitrosocosmicus sp.]
MSKILIVEDDDMQRSNLKSMLQELGSEYQILDSHSADYALELLRTSLIDLFFIDIQLRNESGLKLAKHIRKLPGYGLTWIVFITSHVNYMLEAFKEVHCYDYVLKPYDKAVMHNMTRKLLSSKSGNIHDLDRKYLFVNINGILVRLSIDDIVFIEVFGKTCIIHTANGAYEVKNLSLSKLMDAIPDSKLIQSHRSYAINKNYIRSINKTHACWEISFNNCEKTALVGGKYKDIVMETCTEYSISRR